MKCLSFLRLIGPFCIATIALADEESPTSSTSITAPVPTLTDGLPTDQIPVGKIDDENGSDDSNYTIADPCDCYVVSGPEPGYFQHYRFYDFRQSSATEQGYANSSEPTSSTTRNGHGMRPEGDGRGTAGYRAHHSSLDGSAFVEDWAVQSWDRQGSVLFPISISNSIDNIFMVKNSTDEDDDTTHLVLRTTRMEDYTSTAEVESREKDVFHCSFRVRLRLYADMETVDLSDSITNSTNSTNSTIAPGDLMPADHRTEPPPGVCAGIFTYNSRDVESDIEILTSDPHERIRYSNQPDWDPITDEDIPGASTIVDLPVPWSTWANHRIDWFPDISRWYLNDDLKLQKTYGVPYKPSLLVMNLWSDGGVWSGNLSVGSSVYMGVEWIEVAYNTSSNYGMGFDKTERSPDGEDEHTSDPTAPDSRSSRWNGKVEPDQIPFRPGQKRLRNDEWGNYDGDDGEDHRHEEEEEEEEKEYNILDSDKKAGETQYRNAVTDHEKRKKRKDRGERCHAVCKVDDVETIGIPERVWDRWED